MIAQRLAERLIRLACRSLPEPDRDGRYREWTAEAAAILDDSGTRSRARRNVRALLFAADHIRGARRLARRAGIPRAGRDIRARLLFPLYVMGIAFFSTLWLPVVFPVRLTLWELVLGAGMAYQMGRERRYWLSRCELEFEQDRVIRRQILALWCFMVSMQLWNRMLPANTLAASICCVLSAQIVAWFVERWIFSGKVSGGALDDRG